MKSIRVVAETPKQFEKFKNALIKIAVECRDPIQVFRITNPHHLSLLKGTRQRVYVLPKGLSCMKAWERKTFEERARASNISIYEISETKFKGLLAEAADPKMASIDTRLDFKENEGGD